MTRGVIVSFRTFILSVFARSLRSNFYELHFRAVNSNKKSVVIRW